MHKFDPKRMERLLNPERRQWQDPEVIMNGLGLAPGMSMADIGSGPGFYTLPAAERVGPSGRVYALDIEPAMLEYLRERAAAAGLDNVEVMVSREAKLPLPGEAVDTALLVNVLHEAADRVGLLREIARILRPSGALAVVEWRKEATEKGPPLEERISPEEVEAALRSAGFRVVAGFEVGPYHYGICAGR